MVEAAGLALPYPEVTSIDEDSLGEQNLALAMELPERPLVLGGCCCAHVGAVEALAARHGRIALVWLDAHGDLNTPATSPSGDAWGMPLRMLLEADAIEPEDTLLIGARQLDPGEEAYLDTHPIRRDIDGLDAALADTEGAYVALDADAIAPGAIAAFMPETGGPSLADVERLFERLRKRTPVLGAGLTGLRPEPANVEPLTRLCSALGL
jgi:arginase